VHLQRLSTALSRADLWWLSRKSLWQFADSCAPPYRRLPPHHRVRRSRGFIFIGGLYTYARLSRGPEKVDPARRDFRARRLKSAANARGHRRPVFGHS